MIYLLKIRDKLISGNDERSVNAKKNILISFLAKGGSIIASLLIVPITIDYVNPTKYGIWLTLSSIIGWFGFFDIGFGNGLKNKLAEAIAEGNVELGKKYVSTTYLILATISIVLLIVFVIVNQFIDWTSILNTPIEYAKELSIVALIVFSIFSFQFVFQLINIVCLASQSTRITAVYNFLGNLLGLIIILFLTKYTKGSLLYLCLSIGISPVIMQFIFSIFLYKSKFKEFAPSIRFANLKYAKDIMNLGFKFFLIQIGLLFFYNSNNIIITQIIGPEAVTPYNIAFKYFGVITMLSGIIMTPFWPAFTEANMHKDYTWIKSTVKRLEYVAFWAFLLSVLMLILSPYLYKYWVGEKVQIPFSLSIELCLYVALNMYRTIFCYYANGVGKIHLQLILIVGSGIINIPLAIFFGKIFGISGIVLSTTLLCLLCAIIEVMQYKKLINNQASGIWNR